MEGLKQMLVIEKNLNNTFLKVKYSHFPVVQLNSCASIRMWSKCDLSDFESGIVVGAEVQIFHKLLIY